VTGLTAVGEPRYRIDDCRSCRAPVIWAQTVNGKAQPVDAQPSDGGNIRLQPGLPGKPPRAIVVTPKLAFGQTALRKPHHMTCPDGPRWKKKGGGRR
jgi:hypothetical protein